MGSGSRLSPAGYGRLMLLVAGLGGLLYGIDVGIIGGALPYLEATSHLSRGQISIIVAAVLLGSVFSTLFAGLLADWMGRKPLMLLSGVAFSISVPIIALSQGFGPLFLGRLLQGMSGGLVGVVVPLYLAECLPAKVRGKGTGIFQWLLTLGIFVAALIGIYTSYHVMEIARTASAGCAVCGEGQGVAEHLLDVAATGVALRCCGVLYFGVAAVAVSTRPHRCGTGGTGTLADNGSGCNRDG